MTPITRGGYLTV